MILEETVICFCLLPGEGWAIIQRPGGQTALVWSGHVKWSQHLTGILLTTKEQMFWNWVSAVMNGGGLIGCTTDAFDPQQGHFICALEMFRPRHKQRVIHSCKQHIKTGSLLMSKNSSYTLFKVFAWERFKLILDLSKFFVLCPRALRKQTYKHKKPAIPFAIDEESWSLYTFVHRLV